MSQMKKCNAVHCPWCAKNYTVIKKIADTKVSNRCPVCKNCYEVDCNTMLAKKIKPISSKELHFI